MSFLIIQDVHTPPDQKGELVKLTLEVNHTTVYLFLIILEKYFL